MPKKDSPNWLWEKLGFSIKRDGNFRRIFDNKGEIVCNNCPHDIEAAIGIWLYYGAVV